MITESDVDLVNKSDYYEVVRKIEKEVLDGLLPKENVSMESLLVNYPPPPIDPFRYRACFLILLSPII